MTRRADVKRQTAETSILVSMDLDGTGKADIRTGIGFFDHMLHQIARHGQIDLTVMCDGDLHIDGHHSVEDIGIAMGQCLAKALGDKAGITRFALQRMNFVSCRCLWRMPGRLLREMILLQDFGKVMNS